MFQRRFLHKLVPAFCLLTGFLSSSVAHAQDLPDTYAPHKALSAFVEYSNDSSHMLLGYAEGRKITAIGAGFEKRSFVSSQVAGAWVAEIRPYMIVTDPTMTGFNLQFPQQPAYSGLVSFQQAVPVDKPVSKAPLNVILLTQGQVYNGTATYMGGTRSTYVSGISPLGYKLKVFPHHRFQPFVTGLGGFAVSPRDIPVFNSSQFNFTFECGAGVEVFQTYTRSMRLEYRYHHLANIGSGAENPGIDSGVFKATYSFGR